jgi:hypothetical protein
MGRLGLPRRPLAEVGLTTDAEAGEEVPRRPEVVGDGHAPALGHEAAEARWERAAREEDHDRVGGLERTKVQVGRRVDRDVVLLGQRHELAQPVPLGVVGRVLLLGLSQPGCPQPA